MNRLEFLRTFHNISIEDYTLLSSKLRTKFFKKGESIIVPGQIQTELYFINSGVQMSFHQTDSKFIVIAFTYAPHLSGIPESFLLQNPSKYTLVSITDSQVEYISYNELQTLFDKSQQIERLFRRMTEYILSGSILRHVEIRELSIEARYLIFCQRSPHLLQMVPHKFIASYLGIDPTNFSKLFNTVKY